VLAQYHGRHRLFLVQAVDLRREMRNLVSEFRFSAVRGKELETKQAS
jgi:hypothetical protein